jgi:uncharacterized membrane protein YphA (DoxX/SURF4 family)
MKTQNPLFIWVLRLIVSVILLQTLYFKFSGHPESVALFSKLGVEPWGRIALGCIELLVGITLLIPKTSGWAAFFSTGILAGAIGTHLLIIGVETNDDGGLLFLMAVTGFIASSVLFLLFLRQRRRLQTASGTR